MDYKLAVIVGRFQPVHNSHIEIIRQALEIADNLLIIIGSVNAAPNIKNPFTFAERKHLIQISLTEDENKRVSFEGVRDYYYNDNVWLTEVQQCIRLHARDHEPVVLIGHYKDGSSFYLNSFPQYDFLPARNAKPLDSTAIRQQLFDESNILVREGWVDKIKDSISFHFGIMDVPELVGNWLDEVFCGSEKHLTLIKEYKFIQDYKAKWSVAPFAPTFVTTDTIVVQSGHVLVVKRRHEPGKGLLALPGGFIKVDETIEQAAIRELKEETGIRLNKADLKRAIVESKVFDYPGRSLRGRTISHAFYLKLDEKELPHIRANDDAEDAQWISLMNLSSLESNFFEDHFALINYFISRG